MSQSNRRIASALSLAMLCAIPAFLTSHASQPADSPPERVIHSLSEGLDQGKSAPSSESDSASFGSPSDFELALFKAAIFKKVQQCWILPNGLKKLGKAEVTVRMLLREDGRLISPPEIVSPIPAGGRKAKRYKLFAESAERAAKDCQPYDFLPVQHFDQWQEVMLYFIYP